MSLSGARIKTEPPAPGTNLGEVVRYYTEVARLEVPDWDLELVPLVGKNPRVNGAAWQELASSDPQTVLDLVVAAKSRANGIGALMNRHIAFDVDDRTALPVGLASIFEEGLSSSTHPDRSHYVFRVPTGLRFGGSKVKLDPAFGARAKWGEIKGWNSQIRIWSPNPDGTHVAMRPGRVPELPAVLTGLLLPPLAPGDMATSAELDDFLAEHRQESRPGWLAEDVARFERDCRDMSKYEAVVKRQLQLALNAAAGLYPAQAAYDRLLDAYRTACVVDRDWDESERVAKYRTAWRGAVAKVTRDPELIASVEEKRRGTGAVSWDPEHDEGDAMLSDWFDSWAASWGVVRDALPTSGPDVLELLHAENGDRVEAAGEVPEVTRASANGDAGGDTPDNTPALVEGRVEPPAIEPPEPETISAYDAYMERLLTEERDDVLAEVKRSMVREAAAQQLRIIRGGGPVEPRRLDLAKPRVVTLPSILTLAGRSDGMGLFYPGSITNLIGDKAAGKSWLLMLMALGEIRRTGVRVAWLDWEMSEDRFLDRLANLRATQAQVDHFDYFDMGSATFDDARLSLNRMPVGSILVLDSVSRALAAEMGVSGDGGEEDNTAYVSWLARVAGMRSARQMSMFLIEHTGHTNKHRGRGASAKGQQADAEFTMDVVDHWNRDEKGWAALTCRKDRSGHLIENEPAYGAFFQPLGGGELEVEVRELNDWERVFAGDALLDEDVRARREREADRESRKAEKKDSLAEKVIAVLSTAEAPLSRKEIATRLRANRNMVSEAVRELLEDGRVAAMGGSMGPSAKVRLAGAADGSEPPSGQPESRAEDE